ncbi:MAG TPA: hypothetical protein PLP02_01275 [Bacillota bacterium]|nr:hypothetical protein [Bacillota bacterium]
MKKITHVLVFFFLIIASFVFYTVKVSASSPVNLYFFYDITCGHCQEEDAYLSLLESEYPDIVVNRYELSESDYNLALYDSVRETFGKSMSLTPLLVIGGVALTGFSEQTETDIVSLIERYTTATDYVDVTEKIINGETVDRDDIEYLRFSWGDYVYIPIFGNVSVDSFSLIVAAIVIGLVDGFNPCAMWILLFLITLLVELPDKRRRWTLGIAFLLTSGIFYFLIMTTWLKIGISIAAIKWVRIAIASFALAFGIYNITRFVISLKHKETGCDVTNVKMKRKFQDMVRSSVAKKNILMAIFGIMLVAIAVNFLELACSAGLPLLFTQILAYRSLPYAIYLMYIGIYVFFFLVDDIAVFVISMITLEVKGISNRFGKVSQLVGGAIMIAIGILLMFFPTIIMLS